MSQKDKDKARLKHILLSLLTGIIAMLVGVLGFGAYGVTLYVLFLIGSLSYDTSVMLTEVKGWAGKDDDRVL